jgi:GPH family glycoside/pentoside/hexuronide:cation symporter
MTKSKKRTARIAEEDKVPFLSKLAYAAAGPVDVLGIWVLVSIAYQVFNMELKMPPTYVAIILMSLRLWDGVLDPIMGWISDNTRTKWGRRRPYIFVGAILAGLLYPLIWWFPTDLTTVQIMLWVIGFGILFYTFFTVWGIPYQSLLMEMTPDYNERTRVAEVRSYFQTVAGFVNGWIWWLSMLPVFWIVVDGEAVASPINGMRYISLIIGGLIVVLGILPAIFLKERYYESDVVQNQKKIKFITGIKETFNNRPFIILSLLTVFFLMGQAIFDGYGRYVGTYYVLGGDWGKGAVFAGYGTVVYTVFSLLFIPIFRRLSERVGKKKVLTIAIGLAIVSYATTWWTFTPGDTWVVLNEPFSIFGFVIHEVPGKPWLMLLNTVFIGAGYAGLWLMLPSMQVDVVDYDELKTGERREGSFSSIYSWVLKLSFMVGFLISGPLLELTGFDASVGNLQPDYVYTNMRIGFLAIPLTALGIAMFLLQMFPITAQKAAEIRAQLEARRGKV